MSDWWNAWTRAMEMKQEKVRQHHQQLLIVFNIKQKHEKNCPEIYTQFIESLHNKMCTDGVESLKYSFIESVPIIHKQITQRNLLLDELSRTSSCAQLQKVQKKYL